ncbi:ketoacyl-ACP synthase III [Streptomyces roseirectus]|uniref:Ketoacyl-ACP synthase III n=1 Tax=Streptomyces roseirectus TaxID=2768066 RepID=A0A7H0INE2_9ACTN|nr:ketoacyl-ACP synthase III [Streptomyces roseirectus]QNP74308.1 ketoacyl-ACP synthase III [Streptomyces roseirectus]
MNASVGVVGAGSYLPRRRRTNDEVAPAAGVSAEWIAARTGVLARHAAAPDEAASDLGAAALKSALAAAHLEVEQLGLIVAATSTPDELGPATACRVQALVGARHAVALDVTAACSGWLFGARVARDWLAGDPSARYAAVVGVETYSKFVDPADRATASLFGDGAAATLLGPVADGFGFGPFTLGSDGRYADHAMIAAGGSRLPVNADGQRITMNGKAVRDFILDVFPRMLAHALCQGRVTLADVALVVTHQPNPVLLQQAARQMGVTDRQLIVVGDEVGNIGAANIPYALAKAASEGRLRHGDLVVIIAFGGGVTWGTTLLRWTGAPAIRVAPAAGHLQLR